MADQGGAAAQKVVPGAPPPPVLTAIDMMLREWTRVEADRLDWTYQRTEMQNKIDRLEKAVAEHERTKANLTRQLQALEFGLRQERARNSKKAFGDLNGSDLSSTAVHIDTSKPSDKEPGRLSKKAGTGSLNKGYQTLPANLSRDLTSGNLTPGRDFLKRYLETSGYQLPGASAGMIKPKAPGAGGASPAPAPAGSSLSVASAIGRRPSGADEQAGAAAGDDKFALLNRKKAGSVSISGVKGAPAVAADKKASGDAPSPAPAPSPTGGAAPAAAPKAPSPVAAGTPIKPDAKDAKGAAAVAVDEKKGVLGALTDLCAKFADPKNSTQWKQPLVLKSHMDGVRSVAWHDKEPVLLTASEDGTVKFWNLTQALKDKKKKAPKPAEPQFQYMGHRGMVTSVAFRAKGAVNVFTAGVDGKVISWKLPSLKHDPYAEQGKCSAFKKCVYKHKDAVWSVCAHPTEALLFSASADGVVCAWKLDDDDSGEVATPTRFSFAHLEPSSGERAIPTAIAPVHTDPHKIVVSYANGDVCIVDLSTGKAASIIKPPEPSDMTTSSGNKHALSIATHPALPLAISGHLDQCIRLYDLNASNSRAASCVGVVRAHRDAVTSVHIEPMLGTQCATASHDQSVRFWDLGTRKVTQILEPYQTHHKKFDEGIHAVAYHPALSCVATAGADSVVKVWGM